MILLRLPRFVHRVLSVLAACVVLAGCQNESPERLIDAARAHLERGDIAAAVIQLRNALQQQPDNGAARLLFGQALLAARDPVGAEKELRKALETGQEPEAVLPLLARAMFELGESARLVREFGDRQLAGAADASFRSTLGEALLQLGRRQEAAAAFSAAVAVDARHVPAQIGFARLLASEGRVEEAGQLIDRIASAHPDKAEALALQSDLRLVRGDRAGSLQSLERAVVVDAGYLPARYALIAMLIEDRRFDAASAQVADARTKRKGDVQLVYFDGLIALGKGDTPQARDAAQQVLKHAPDHVPSLMLAAAVELQDKRPTPAESFLRRALALAPEHPGARRLLVQTHLGANQPGKALDAIRPLVAGREAGDPQLMMLAGDTYLANDDAAQASFYFASAAETDQQKGAARTRLGQIRLAAGDTDAGIRELESAAATKGAPAQADLALISEYMRRNELDKALAAALAFEKKQPRSPLAQQLIGSVYAAKKDATAARKRFERALELDPNYLPAVVGLATLDLAEGKPADARRRFEAQIERNPKNEQALLGLAELQARTGAPAAEVQGTLRRAVAANPQSVNARLALVSHLLAQGDAKSALAAAQEANAAIPNDASILVMLAQAQDAAAEPNQAVDTFNRAAALQSGTPTALIQLGAMHGRRGDYAKATEALKRAQRIAPANATITRDLVVAYLRLNRPDDAIREAKALQAAAPTNAAGFILEGDVQATRKNWPAAEAAYRAGLKLEPASGLLATKLHGALLAADKKAEADALSKKWLADHPRDAAMRSYLGERALQAKDYKSAITQYEAVVAIDPNNVVALNNLAFAAGRVGDPRAIQYAERAASLAPRNAAVLDTFGMLLVAKGDTGKGLEYLGRASALAPGRHDIRFNYAKALAKAGQKDAARTELERLQAVKEDFPGKSEIPDLLRSL